MPDRITKFIESLDEKTKARLKEKLSLLKENPFQMAQVKKLTTWGEKTYRFRMGNIRIIYKVHEDNAVEILDIDYRGNLY